ncbi:hypothetical protein [Mycolicibacterium litorale]|uniref:Uncharacterized protein n=1 Tax=Mycolicibacterium litorale TaxID=758802 RepID=A0AAD1IPW1_9MYCO|nr:hypothetical protein [Mycolicibacterium litorale]MCV7417283.1 hypothetical protein [Mycolicibacterium litorale]TDY05071.1 hypothetical protein BCL50_3854 [Mycolicibacterium litorale]BBY18503.1 hypothetical protein MLIT_40950 [Mycolicibacterium litorale]
MSTLNRNYPAIQGEFEDESEFAFEFEGLADAEDEGEGEWEFEFESAAEAELEAEFEDEFEDEGEGFVNPVRRIYRDAETMAHLAQQAALSESEDEAEAFIGALVPLAARIIPRATRVLAGNVPALVRSTRRVAAVLRRDPQTRKLVRALPVVLQRTAQSLADQADAGQVIDADSVARTVGRMTGRVLRGPNGARALRAVDVFDRRWRRRARRGRQGRRTGYVAGSRAQSPRVAYGRSGYGRGR